MARPKGSGGRSSYDRKRKYSRTGLKFRIRGNKRRRATGSGKFVKGGGNPFSKTRTRRARKSRFDR